MWHFPLVFELPHPERDITGKWLPCDFRFVALESSVKTDSLDSITLLTTHIQFSMYTTLTVQWNGFTTGRPFAYMRLFQCAWVLCVQFHIFFFFFYTFNPLLINYLNVLSPSSLLCSLFWDVTLCTYVHCNAWCYDDLVIPSQPPPFITLAPLWRTRACRHHQDTPKKEKNRETQEWYQHNPKKKKKKHPEESCIRAHSHFYPPICAQLTFTFSSSGLPGRDFCEEKACEVRQGKSH